MKIITHIKICKMILKLYLGERIIALNVYTYFKKSQPSDLSFYLDKLEKEVQIKPKEKNKNNTD